MEDVRLPAPNHDRGGAGVFNGFPQEPSLNLQIFSLLLLCMGPALLCAQTTRLSIAQVAAPRGHAAFSLNVAGDGSTDIAALQWAVQCTPGTIASVSVAEKDAAFSANKQISCSTHKDGVTCILVGPNSSPIPNGSVALITLALDPEAQSDISLSSAMAASSEGGAVSAEIPANSIRLSQSAERQVTPPANDRDMPAVSTTPKMAPLPTVQTIAGPPMSQVSPSIFTQRISAQTNVPAATATPIAAFAVVPLVGQSEALNESPKNKESTVDAHPENARAGCAAESESHSAAPNDQETRECPPGRTHTAVHKHLRDHRQAAAPRRNRPPNSFANVLRSRLR